VKPDGTATIFASGLWFRSIASGDLAFGFNGDLFALEDGFGRILRFAPGSVPGPKLELATLELDFGEVYLGQSRELPIAVKNTGEAELAVRSITSDNPAFTVVSPVLPFTVAKGAQREVMVRYTPSQAAPQTASLVFESNDPSAVLPTAGLRGAGLSTAGQPVPVPAGLVAWWPGNGAALDVKGTNHGVMMNGVAFDTGMVAQAFRFDGIDDYVSTPLDVSPAVLPTTTWEAWVYPTRPGGRSQILSDDDGGYDRSVLVEGNNFGVFTGHEVWQPVAIDFNQWQHIAVIFSPANVEFYKNGVRYSYGLAPVGQSTQFRLQIGRNPGYGEYFQGRIDEVSVYDRALSPVEIQNIYTAGSGGKEDNGIEPSISLAIRRAGADILISWPASATNYVLQSVYSLAVPISWQLVTDPIATSNSWRVFTVPPSARSQGAVYYRLSGARGSP
jgi:hypothetical protein